METPELSEQAKHFKIGTYQHFKGGLYQALFVARSSEKRNEEFVVYQSVEKEHVWIRPLKMFLEEVEVYGKKVSRFTFTEK